jgi:cysteine desulfurase
LASKRAYFDWNATAPLRPEAHAAMLAGLEVTGNASSVHAEGRAARRLVEEARTTVAALAGAEPQNVIFTSGATEANMLALTPSFGGAPTRDRLFVSAIEHPSVRSGGRFAEGHVEELPVTTDGIVDLGALKAAVSRATHPLVSVMVANNETGVVQPIREAAEIVHEAGGLLHVDAVQGAGRIPIGMAELGADLMSLSSHKIGGPQGAGALIRRAGLSPEPLIKGGGQERGFRAGTENVAAIAGFGAAVEAALCGLAAEPAKMAALRARLEAEIRAITPDVVIFAERAERLPNTSLVAVPGTKAETALIAFDLNGIALSSGSACSSGKVQPSHVLAAMRVEPALVRAALRISLGWKTNEADLDLCLNAWKQVVSSLGTERGGRAA